MIFSRPDPDPGKKPDPDEYFHLYYDYFQYEMISFYIFWRSSFKFFPSKTFGAVSVHFCAKDPDPEKIENRLRIQAKITNSKPWHWQLAEFHWNFPSVFIRTVIIFLAKSAGDRSGGLYTYIWRTNTDTTDKEASTYTDGTKFSNTKYLINTLNMLSGRIYLLYFYVFFSDEPWLKMYSSASRLLEI